MFTTLDQINYELIRQTYMFYFIFNGYVLIQLNFDSELVDILWLDVMDNLITELLHYKLQNKY